MKRLHQLVSIGALGLAIATAPISSLAEPNELPADEQADGFQSLFNGRDLSGWEQTPDRSYATSIAPSGQPQPPRRVVPAPKVWEINDDALYCSGRSGQSPEDAYLTYQAAKLPADFELEFRWKFGQIAPEVAAARASLPVGGKHTFPGLPAVPAKKRDGFLEISVVRIPVTQVRNNQTRSLQRCQAIYRCPIAGNLVAFATAEIDIENDENPSQFYNYSPGAEIACAAGKWHDCRIVCQGTRSTHWIDGKELLNYDLATDEVLSPDMLAPWMRWKAQGLELRLESLGYQSWYRDIRVRVIQSAATQSSPSQRKL